MKISKCLFLIIAVTLCSSCGHKKEAKEVTQNFFRAIKNDKEEDMSKYYPNVSELQNYYKSDTIIIKEVTSLEDDKYSVQLTNKFTNGFGKTTESEIVVYAKPKNADKLSEGYIIYDTKGLCNLSDDAVYKYAKRKGVIKGFDLTDQQVAKKVKEATTTLITDVFKFKAYLMDNVKVANWNWETSDYSYSASGRGVVKNNTGFSIPKLKYIVTYKLSNGTEVTQDDGYVAYDDIRPYGSESFSFYTSYVGNASKASIDLVFDEDFLIETVANGNFEE